MKMSGSGHGLATAVFLLGLLVFPACGGHSGGATDASPAVDSACDGGHGGDAADASTSVDARENRWDEMKWDEGKWQ